LDTGAQGLYIAATDAASGKTAIALGVAEAMSRRVQRLGVFRPVVAGGPTPDPVVELLRTRYRVGGDPALLGREAAGLVVAAMSLPNVLDRLTEGVAVIAPGDRTAGLVPGLLAAHQASNFPSLSAVFLTGGFTMPDSVRRLLDGWDSPLPIISTAEDTLQTALHLSAVRGEIAAASTGKIETALGVFARAVDAGALLDRLNVTRSAAVTPLMFQSQLIERARSHRRTIVLPEGGDDRILRAADLVLRRGAADFVLLGQADQILARAATLGLDLGRVRIVDPSDPELVEEFAAEYTKPRAHKGMTLDRARDVVQDVSYFGTLMVRSGRADGMVSGAVHTTAHTIRPAFEIIRTEPGVSIVSSVFFMLLADRVLVYGDCAVNPDPDAQQLADIALSSAKTAAQFGVDPTVALLSYSTGESGTGRDVEKVRGAARLAREKDPDLPLEGPMRYDAAADPEVAALKMPGSRVAGRATVFVVPDLNTGNNLYKAVQRSAGAVAVGPVLQGLRKPVNDLSRGALVQDIVNTIVITAVQAQETGAREIQEAQQARTAREVHAREGVA
jgi:phosphate acetyltransferase